MRNQEKKPAPEHNCRILLTGTYSSANKGDASMQAIFASGVRRYQPGASVTIASPFPDRDVSYYKPTSVIKSRRRNLPLATFHWLLLESLRILRIQITRYPLNKEIDTMISSDVVVDLSGDMLTEDYGPLVGYSHFLPLMQARALGRPTILCAQSIGPFRWLAPLARRIVASATLITVRDRISVFIVNDLHGRGRTAIQTADLAFLLQATPEKRTIAILDLERVGQARGALLGVNVSALLSETNSRHAHDSRATTLVEFAEALDAIIDQMGVTVLLIPHVFGPRAGADDRGACKRVSELMQHTPYRLRGEYKPDELKGVIARCDAFVGCRMHANIAALDSLVPVLAISYSHKTLGILSSLGLDEWAFPVDQLSSVELVKCIKRLLAAVPDYREKLRERIPAVRLQAERNIELVARAIVSGNEDKEQ